MSNIRDTLKFFHLTLQQIKDVELIYLKGMKEVFYEKSLAVIRALQIFYDPEYWDTQVFDPAVKSLSSYTIDMFHKGVVKARYIIDNSQGKEKDFSGNLVAELECIGAASIYNRMIFSFRSGNDLDLNLYPRIYIKKFIIAKMIIHKSSIELFCVQDASQSADFFVNHQKYEKKDYIDNFSQYAEQYKLQSYINIIDIKKLKYSNYEWAGDKVI